MNKKYLINLAAFLLVLGLFVSPVLIFAQGPGGGEESGGSSSSGTCASKYAGNVGLEGFINYIGCIIVSSVVPLMFALAFVLFLWGVVQFIMNNADENKRAQGKQFMVWGIVALFVMFSIWGLVQILSNTVDPNAGKIGVPSLPYNP